MKLKLIGIGKILTGIFALLFGILITLFMMPIRLAQIMKTINNNKENKIQNT